MHGVDVRCTGKWLDIDSKDAVTDDRFHICNLRIEGPVPARSYGSTVEVCWQCTVSAVAAMDLLFLSEDLGIYISSATAFYASTKFILDVSVYDL